MKALTGKQRREVNARFWRLYDRTDFHVRVPNAARFHITVLGQARDLHGPTGVCTCCPRRPQT